VTLFPLPCQKCVLRI